MHLFVRGGPWRSERMVVRMSQHRAQGLIELRGDLCCTCVDSPPEHELRDVRERNERHRNDNRNQAWAYQPSEREPIEQIHRVQRTTRVGGA